MPSAQTLIIDKERELMAFRRLRECADRSAIQLPFSIPMRIPAIPDHAALIKWRLCTAKKSDSLILISCTMWAA
jgi:hypothetical protein